MVGAAIIRVLRAKGCDNILTRTRAELELRDSAAVDRFFAEHRPAVVVLAAARVGGIAANMSAPAAFLVDNLRIGVNVLTAAAAHGATDVLYFGSSCVYPRDAPQPLREDCLLSGPLEPTNEGYALAKIAGIKLAEYLGRSTSLRVVAAMPTNLYGPGDHYDPEKSHVIPGLLQRFHKEKARGSTEVECWGSGRPLREFMHVDDLAAAAAHLLVRHPGFGLVNIGTGEEVTIAALAQLVADAVGFTGRIRWDSTRPDGTPRKLLDLTRLSSTGFVPRVRLREGLAATYAEAVAAGRFDDL